MTDLHSLSVRTTAALDRLAELERRAQRVATNGGSIARPALKELSTALEELQVANEQLETTVLDLGASRQHSDEVLARFDEFVNLLPIACVWTDPGGTILEGNDGAAALLNVARPRLAGKPLMLYIANRIAFFDALAALRTSEQPQIELSVAVRPRERRPREMRLIGRRLQHDTRWCWFLVPGRLVVD
jgi:PAS domain-containing protein